MTDKRCPSCHTGSNAACTGDERKGRFKCSHCLYDSWVDAVSPAFALQRARIRAHAENAARLQTENDALRADALRWRAFIGSARIRPLGCAGLDDSQKDEKYAHLGLEIWTEYPGVHNNTIGIDWLTRYADKAVKALEGNAK